MSMHRLIGLATLGVAFAASSVALAQYPYRPGVWYVGGRPVASPVVVVAPSPGGVAVSRSGIAVAGAPAVISYGPYGSRTIASTPGGSFAYSGRSGTAVGVGGAAVSFGSWPMGYGWYYAPAPSVAVDVGDVSVRVP